MRCVHPAAPVHPLRGRRATSRWRTAIGSHRKAWDLIECGRYENNLGIGFHSDLTVSVNKNLPIDSPLQFRYPVHEIYVCDLVSEIFKLSDVSTKVNFIFTNPYDYRGGELTCSDLFFEWANAKQEGSVLIRPRWKFDEGLIELLRRKYKSRES